MYVIYNIYSISNIYNISNIYSICYVIYIPGDHNLRVFIYMTLYEPGDHIWRFLHIGESNRKNDLIAESDLRFQAFTKKGRSSCQKRCAWKNFRRHKSSFWRPKG